MGLLDGDIASLFSEVFGTFYLDGTLTTNLWVPDGQGGGTYLPTNVPVKYQEDQVDEATRVAGGYSQDDVRFLILQSPPRQEYPWVLESGAWGIGKYWLEGKSWSEVVQALLVNGDSELTAGGRTYLLRTPRQDPAKSYYEVWGVPK